MTPDHVTELPDALRRALGPNWSYRQHGTRLDIEYTRAATTYVPPRRTPDWPDLLHAIEGGFLRTGVRRAPPLPLRWGRETDFTISAVQAVDPYLKDQQPFVLREGFLAQPVVRFTGDRTPDGQLEDGFLTSFVNISHIQRITGLDQHAELLDNWIGVLSELGFHARHLVMSADLATWQRREVSGITIHIAHAGMPIGDCVLLWNTANPTHIITDLGSGLERLMWALTRANWQTTIHGTIAGAEPNTLDALRTVTLLLGTGIHVSNRGCGGALRRLLSRVPAPTTRYGVSRVIRTAHRFWSLTTPLQLPWHEVTCLIERT